MSWRRGALCRDQGFEDCFSGSSSSTSPERGKINSSLNRTGFKPALPFRGLGYRIEPVRTVGGSSLLPPARAPSFSSPSPNTVAAAAAALLPSPTSARRVAQPPKLRRAQPPLQLSSPLAPQSSVPRVRCSSFASLFRASMQEEESVEVGLETMNGGIKEGEEGRVAEVGEEEEEEEEEEEAWSSDSEIENALEWLDLKDGGEAVGGAFAPNSRRPNAHGGLHTRARSSTLQPLFNRSQKLTTHVRASPLEEWEGRVNVGMSSTVTASIRESVRDMAVGKIKSHEKADRATVEQAIDQRTRMVLFKMLNRQVFNDINGCISTGKEANVYHATKSDGQELAIKVYKTSVLVFKDRDRYVQGDFRFRHAYGKHNPRKMVKTWAEKEMRNLMRLKAAGIRCPTPHLLKLHVLVMDFIGKAGWAAPRLKDAALSLDKFANVIES
ncbi:hypothetical protein NL676_009537 [Syzygium grande]|nr:hypothetical protein NL676_009537 [Syzygium grande]